MLLVELIWDIAEGFIVSEEETTTLIIQTPRPKSTHGLILGLKASAGMQVRDLNGTYNYMAIGNAITPETSEVSTWLASGSVEFDGEGGTFDEAVAERFLLNLDGTIEPPVKLGLSTSVSYAVLHETLLRTMLTGTYDVSRDGGLWVDGLEDPCSFEGAMSADGNIFALVGFSDGVEQGPVFVVGVRRPLQRTEQLVKLVPSGRLLSTSAPVEPIALEDGPNEEILLVKGSGYDGWLTGRARRYESRVRTAFGAEMTLQETLQEQSWYLEEQSDESMELEQVENYTISRMLCTMPDGSTNDSTQDGGWFGCKLIFGSDSRILVDNPLEYPNNKHVYYHLGRPSENVMGNFGCSGVFLDETHVLTVAHCVYDNIESHWIYADITPEERPSAVETNFGIDYGRGYVCQSGAIVNPEAFEDYCEFVEARWVAPGFQSSTPLSMDEVVVDYAVLRLQTVNHPNGIGYGAWMAISSIDSARKLQQKTAISHGYPTYHPSLALNGGVYCYYNIDDQDWCFMNSHQYSTSGEVFRKTTSRVLTSKIEVGGGQSGSGVFYYSDNATTYNGQSHYLIGVAAAQVVDNNGTTDNDYTGGPTARQFRDFAYTIMP